MGVNNRAEPPPDPLHYFWAWDHSPSPHANWKVAPHARVLFQKPFEGAHRRRRRRHDFGFMSRPHGFSAHNALIALATAAPAAAGSEPARRADRVRDGRDYILLHYR